MNLDEHYYCHYHEHDGRVVVTASLLAVWVAVDWHLLPEQRDGVGHGATNTAAADKCGR